MKLVSDKTTSASDECREGNEINGEIEHVWGEKQCLS